MTVSAQNTVNSSTANGVTTVFPYTFKITDEADLKVIVDGTEVVSGFTVSGVGNEAGGNVTFSVAPANGLSVVRIRDMSITRDTDYQEGGDLLAETLDADIDRAFLVMQQINEAVGRSYKQPEGSGEAPVFPALEARKFVRVNDAGDALILVDPDPNDADPDNFADATLNGTERVAIKQSGNWLRTTIFSIAAFVTGIYTVTLHAGVGAAARTLLAILRDQPVRIKDFGAVGDGVTDDTASIQAAIDYATSLGTAVVSLGVGSYLVDSVILKSGVKLSTDGGRIKIKAGSLYGLRIASGADNVSVEGITFDCAGLTVNGGISDSGTVIRNIGAATNVRILNNSFYDVAQGQNSHVIVFSGVQAEVSGNYVEQCGGDVLNFNDGHYIVTNNRIFNSDTPGDGGIAFNNNAFGIIANNYIYRCDLGVGMGPVGTTAAGHHTTVISGNEIVGCEFGINMGWYSYAGRVGPRNVKIIGNTIDKCKTRGIAYYGDLDTTPAYMVISANTITNSGSTLYDGLAGDGIGATLSNASNSIISGNIFSDNLGADVVLDTSHRVTISGNHVYGGAYANAGGSAISTSGSNNLSILDNTILGKRILILSCTSPVISGNNLQNTFGTDANHATLVITDTVTTPLIDNNKFHDSYCGINVVDSDGWYRMRLGQNNLFESCTVNIVPAILDTMLGSRVAEGVLTGTVAGDGSFTVAHGLGGSAAYRVVRSTAFYRGNSGEAVPMTLTAVDGTNIYFTGGTASRACRAVIVIDKTLPAW